MAPDVHYGGQLIWILTHQRKLETLRKSKMVDVLTIDVFKCDILKKIPHVLEVQPDLLMSKVI